MTRPRTLLLCLAALVVLLASCSSPSSNAAIVGDDEISVEQLRRDVALFGFLAALSDAPCGTPVEGESQESACARLSLSNDIHIALTQPYADAHGLRPEPAAVQDAIARLEASQGGVSLDAQLAAAGIDRADLESLAERLLLFNAVQQAVADERLDDEALRATYEEQLGTFTTVEVAHILVADRASAERIAAEATPGTFAKIARRESIDPGSAPNGGSLGSYSEDSFRASFDPTFAEAALALEPGEISAPVQTPFGWHVIELVRRDVAPFEEIRDQLRASQAGAVFDAWLRERAAAVGVEVNPRFGRFDEASVDVVPIRSTAEEPVGVTNPAAP